MESNRESCEKPEGAQPEFNRAQMELNRAQSEFNQRSKVDISRFKGLGEMPPAQLKETTMNPESRRLLQVNLPLRDQDGADDRRTVDKLVTTLMGKKPELRFSYIREHAYEVIQELDV